MKIFKSFILILSLIIIFGSGCFYVWKLNGWVYLGFILLLGLLIYPHRCQAIIPRLNQGIRRILQSGWRMTKETQRGTTWKNVILNLFQDLLQILKRCRNEFGMTFRNEKKEIFKWLFSGIFICSVCLIIYYLLRHRTDLPIRSPWEVVNWKLFVLYGIAVASLFVSLLSEIPKWLKWIFIFSFTFLSFGAALILYKIGYGFDPFIHRATEKYIDEFGTISPKPLYYVGQYALVLFFHKIFFLPIAWIDKILVPLLASITLPALFYFWADTAGEKNWKLEIENWKFLVALCATILPFSAFIATTPQSLANLFLLIIIFLTVSSVCHSEQGEESHGRSEATTRADTRVAPISSGLPRDSSLRFASFRMTLIITIISIATFLIHPLSGIPAFLFLGIIILMEKLNGWKKYAVSIFTTILGSMVVPIIFIIRDKTSFQIALNDILPTFRLFVENKFDLFRNFAYLYKFNFWLIFLGLAAIGVLLLIARHKHTALNGLAHESVRKNQNKRALSCATPLILTSLVIFLNAVFLKIFVKFPEVISYEQSDYSNRLIGIAALFLYPLALVPAIYFFKKVTEGNFLIKFFAILFVTYLSISSFYISYPRVDKYESSHGFSTSQFDIEVVKFINEKSADKKYVVLANQSVSAAALQEFGFQDKYYNVVKLPPDAKSRPSQIYFYPIPTGGILYDYYLKMVYGYPSIFTINEAMDIAGAQEAYLVINSYWYGAKGIVKNAKNTADLWWQVGNGRVYIFKYLKSGFDSKTMARDAD